MNALKLLLITALFGAQTEGPIAPRSDDVINKPFVWKGEADSLFRQVPYTASVADDCPGHPDTLALSRDNLFGGEWTPGTYTLRVLGPSVVSRLTSRHYAVTGHLVYRDVTAGSFLELENWFAPSQPGGPESFYFSRTLADAGPMAKIEGSDGGRDFVLPFDASAATTPLTRLVLKLHLMGRGYLEFSNVRLVEYPDTTVTKSAGPANPPRSDALDIHSFVLGILATLGVFMALGGLGALVHFSQRLRHAREMRRMSSLDG